MGAVVTLKIYEEQRDKLHLVYTNTISNASSTASNAMQQQLCTSKAAQRFQASASPSIFKDATPL
jgi:hypothetical protein